MTNAKRDTEPCPPPICRSVVDTVPARIVRNQPRPSPSALALAQWVGSLEESQFKAVIDKIDREIAEAVQSQQVPLSAIKWAEHPLTGDMVPVNVTCRCGKLSEAVGPLLDGRRKPEECEACFWAATLDCAGCGRKITRRRSPPCLGLFNCLGTEDGKSWCGDCASGFHRKPPHVPLDQRIAEAREVPGPADRHECAWSTPTSEGEGWR